MARKIRIEYTGAIYHGMNRAATAVHRMESVRVQLAALRTAVADAEVTRAVAALEEKVTALEMELVDLRQTGTGQDGVRFGSKLISKLGYLANGLISNDFRPTDQQVEVQGILNAQLSQHLSALESLLGGDLNALNALLRQRNVPNVIDGPAIVP